ncbi:MAG: CDP-diacylglycerol--serine O-phosphatidyltransferase [Geobacteraceae bacterium]|nr:CDP-diacylglycerol--serine O-phosphatidyltransferase [Geobacteraceae bacterium]
MRKGIYILPNLFTTGSMFAGFYGMIAGINGDYRTAAICILVSAVFDGLDGKVARATGTTSKFGVEYDSLADLVAFGVAPGLIMYFWALKPFGRLGWLAAFLFVVCGALRLARFNVQVETVESKRFVGLPIPAAASMVASTVLFFQHMGWPSSFTMASVTLLSGTRMPTVFRFETRILGSCFILAAGRMNVYAPGMRCFIILNAALLTFAYSLM